MSEAPSWYDWARLIGVVATSAATVVLFAAVGVRLTHRAAWARLIWRLAVVALFLLLCGELTGVTRGFAGWAAAYYFAPSQRDAVHRNGIVGAPGEAAKSRSDGSPWPYLPHGDFEPWAGSWSQSSMAGQSSVESRDAEIANAGYSPFGERRVWWPGLVWASVALLLGARLVIGRLLGAIWRRRNVTEHDAELQSRVHEISRRLGLGRVRSVVVPGITSPIAFGVIRPTVGVPPRFAIEFDATQQSVMLAHELEHLGARDPMWYFLADLVAAALWWHPLVLWARHQLRTASEWAADEASLVVRDGPDVLAACLVQLGARLLRSQRFARVGIQGSGFRSSLGRRVTRLLNLGDRTWSRPGGLASFSLKALGPAAMVAAALVSTGWSTPETISKGETMQLTLRESWRSSLAAAALFSVFGTDKLPAETILPDESAVVSVASDSDDDAKQAVKEAMAIKEKLQQIERQMVELKEAGRIEEAKNLSGAAAELKMRLEKLHVPEKVFANKFTGKEKKSSDSIDELHDRLKKLERENAELRTALGVKLKTSDAAGGKSREDVERVHKELLEMHEKLTREGAHGAKKLDDVKRQYLEKTKELPGQKLHWWVEPKEAGNVREHLEMLAKVKAKLEADGRHEEAERLEAEVQKLKAAGAWPEKADVQKWSSSQTQELTGMLKELREEVGRLRNEVSELRQMVKGGESKDSKR